MSLETIHNPAREEAVLRILHKKNILGNNLFWTDEGKA